MTTPLPVLRQLLNEATSGPWFAWDRGVGWHIAVEDPNGPTEDRYGRPRLLPEGDKTDLARGEDAALIVALRNAAPALLDRLERQAAAIEAVQELADDYEVEARLRTQRAGALPDAPSYRDEVIRLTTAAKHQQRAADAITRLLSGITPTTEEKA